MVEKRNAAVGLVYDNVVLNILNYLHPVRSIRVENVPREPVIFAANHKTFYDALLLEKAVSRIRDRKSKGVSFVYRRHEKGPKWKFVDWVSGKRGNIILGRRVPVSHYERLRAAVTVKNEGKEVLSRGYDVGIFPEGRFPKKGEDLKEDGLGVFNGGVSSLAIEDGSKIVPVYISNGDMRRYRPVTVSFGSPIDPEDYKKKNRRDLSKRVRDAVLELKG